MKQILTVALTLVVAGTLVVAQNARDPQVLFKAAQHTEEVQGDLKAAIVQYQLVVASGNRGLAAQALLRMAACYDKLGGTESRAIYERVAREYADQREAVAIAQARLGGAVRTAQKSITLRRVWDGRASESTAAVLTTVSRDGRRLAYQPLGTGTVNVHDLATGADRVLDGPALAGAPAISRDGTQVAYAWYGGAYGSELRIVNVPQHGSPVPRRLYESAEATQITPMDFSPDGTSVVVLLGRRTDRTHQIGLVNAHDGSLRVLKSLAWRFPTRIFFSPDGHDLAYDLPASDSSDQRDVFVLAVDGSREVPVVVHPSHDIVMGWSPDGKHLLFASDRRGGAMGLWAQALAGPTPPAAPVLVKESIGSSWSMGVTSSGALYLGTAAGDRDITVASVDLVTGKEIGNPVRPVQSFIGSSLQPAWSPDGKSLAYVSLRAYNPVSGIPRILAIQSTETGEVRELRPKLSYWNQMSWARDGRALVTGGWDLNQREGIFRIDARTGDVVPIVLLPESNDFANSYPQWSPDGKRIYYRRRFAIEGPAVAFVERDLASGREREIIRGELGSINLSPDGRWIAAQKADSSTQTQTVVLIPVDGGETRELLPASSGQGILRFNGMPWTPDGRGVIVRKVLSGGMRQSTSELWLVPITDAAPRRLDIDTNQWAAGNIGVISLNPDGKQIAFLTGQVNSEVWVLEDFLPALNANTPGSRQR